MGIGAGRKREIRFYEDEQANSLSMLNDIKEIAAQVNAITTRKNQAKYVIPMSYVAFFDPIVDCIFTLIKQAETLTAHYPANPHFSAISSLLFLLNEHLVNDAHNPNFNAIENCLSILITQLELNRHHSPIQHAANNKNHHTEQT